MWRFSAWLTTGSAAWLDHIFGLWLYDVCVFFCTIKRDGKHLLDTTTSYSNCPNGIFPTRRRRHKPEKCKVLESRCYCGAERREFNKFDRMIIMRPMANWCNFFHLQFRKLCFNCIQQTGNSRARRITNILAESPCNEIFKFMNKLSSLSLAHGLINTCNATIVIPTTRRGEY